MHNILTNLIDLVSQVDSTAYINTSRWIAG